MFGKDWKRIAKNVRRGHTDKILAAVYRKYFRMRGPPNSTPIHEQDWDYLLVLDACRFDTFRDHHPFEGGRLEKHVSRGSTSIEFFNRNFTDYYDDIVYTSANGYISEVSDARFQRKHFDGSAHFHEMVELYLEDDPRSEAKLTPEFIVERGLETVEEHPDRRHIVHLMSPHSPYIGESAPNNSWHIRDYVANGYTRDEIMEFYVEDFLRAAEAVQKFIDSVDGKIVITADHGELFGEHGLYMHPHSVYFRELIEVPWYILESGERPEIRSEDTGDLDI